VYLSLHMSYDMGKCYLWLNYTDGVQPTICITQPTNIVNLVQELTRWCS